MDTWRMAAAMFLLSFCCLIKLGAQASPPVSSQAEILKVLVGGSILLPCNALSPGGGITPGGIPHAAWSRPHDHRQVTRDGMVAGSLRQRARVTGNSTRGEFHLHIRYAKFPDDNGTWWCDAFNGPRVGVSVTVLVPPATHKPIVTPIIGLVFEVTSEAWTFSCFAHHAYPPVALSWRRKSGPLTPYSRLPLGDVAAPDGTSAVSVDLTLTAVNNDSVFVCHAEHPTFNGHRYSTHIQFRILDPSLRHNAAALGDPPSTSSGFTTSDALLVATGFTLLMLATCITGCLWRTSHKWELDVRDERPYMHLSTSETSATCILNTHRASFASEKKDSQWQDRGKRRCMRRLAMAGILLSIIIIALTLVIPLYIRSFSIPTAGVDSIVPVMAGSMLWLDCSGVTGGAGDNLLEVVWRKGMERFYTQYPRDASILGIPANSSSAGTTTGFRAKSRALGQIMVWPVLPSDQGLYICEAARMLDDTGRTTFQRHTFGVIVMEGPQVSLALLITAVIGLLAAVLLLVLGIYHSIRVRYDIPEHQTIKEEELS